MKSFKKAVWLLTVLFASMVSAQAPQGHTPDYQKIKKAIEDKKSEFHYPKLMARLQERDTTMSEEGFRHLYFGYIFQKEYDPYGHSAKKEELGKYAEKEKLEGADLETAITLSNEVLKQDPFDLQVLNFLSYCYHTKGDAAMSRKVGTIFNRIIETILLSGDGMTCKTGFHVQNVSHEYALLNVFGMESISQGVADSCDFLQFEKGKHKLDGMYFDISKMKEHMMGEIGK